LLIYLIIGEVIMASGKSGGKCPLLQGKCLETSCAGWLTEEDTCSIINVARALNTQKNIYSS
jgi:hypothetical protein